MKREMIPIVLLSVWLLGSSVGATPTETVGPDTQEQPIADIVKRAPGQSTLLFENDYIRVIRFRLAPGDRLPMHVAGNRIVFWLSEFILKLTTASETTYLSRHHGDVDWHPADSHAVENIGRNEARYIVFARKPSAMPRPRSEMLEDVTALAPETASIRFENSDFKIIEVQLEPGEKQPAHGGLHRVVYSLSDYRVTYTTDGKTFDKEFKQGDVHWHPSDIHSVENTGDSTAAYLIVALKPKPTT